MLTYGATLIRAGQSAKAIDQLENALQSGGNDVAAPALLLLTIACQSAGRNEEAQQWFEQATQTLDESTQAKDDLAAWDRRLELELLRNEAERRVKEAKP